MAIDNHNELIIWQYQLGKFTIGIDWIKNKPEIVKMIMGKMIILRAKFESSDGLMHYKAISDLFRELKWGDMIPHYQINIKQDNREVIISAQEIKKCDYQIMMRDLVEDTFEEIRTEDEI